MDCWLDLQSKFSVVKFHGENQLTHCAYSQPRVTNQLHRKILGSRSDRAQFLL